MGPALSERPGHLGPRPGRAGRWRGSEHQPRVGLARGQLQGARLDLDRSPRLAQRDREGAGDQVGEHEPPPVIANGLGPVPHAHAPDAISAMSGLHRRPGPGERRVERALHAGEAGEPGHLRAGRPAADHLEHAGRPEADPRHDDPEPTLPFEPPHAEPALKIGPTRESDAGTRVICVPALGREDPHRAVDHRLPVGPGDFHLDLREGRAFDDQPGLPVAHDPARLGGRRELFVGLPPVVVTRLGIAADEPPRPIARVVGEDPTGRALIRARPRGDIRAGGDRPAEAAVVVGDNLSLVVDAQRNPTRRTVGPGDPGLALDRVGQDGEVVGRRRDRGECGEQHRAEGMSHHGRLLPGRVLDPPGLGRRAGPGRDSGEGRAADPGLTSPKHVIARRWSRTGLQPSRRSARNARRSVRSESRSWVIALGSRRADRAGVDRSDRTTVGRVARLAATLPRC